MTKLIIDSYAWIEYLDGTPKGQVVRKIIEDDQTKSHTCSLTISEVVSKFVRKGLDPDIALQSILSISEIMEIDHNTAFLAGKFHGEIRKKINDFGLVDSFIAVLAENKNAKILTGDPHFKGFKNTIMI